MSLGNDRVNQQKPSAGWSRRAVLGAAICVPFARSANAQTYPSRNPHVIVPFAAGGPTDVLTRIAADRVSPALGQKLVVESRAGAGGNLAAEAVVRAEADGYTLLVAGQAILAINKALYKKLNYDPAADFRLVGMLGVIANVLLVNPKTVPVNSVAELIALAKQKPGTMSFAYANALGQLAGEMLKRRAGIDIQAVPYKSSPEGMTDVMAGRVSMMFNDATATQSLAQSGQLRALATITKDRSKLLSELPTIQEQGVDLGNLSAWTGLFAPKGTPPEVVEKLSGALRDILAEPAIRQRLAEIGFEEQWLNAKDFGEFVAAENETWATLTKEAGIERQ
jgi:tripartite-type tricarboxylate transporter receptor subunit TctC